MPISFLDLPTALPFKGPLSLPVQNLAGCTTLLVRLYWMKRTIYWMEVSLYTIQSRTIVGPLHITDIYYQKINNENIEHSGLHFKNRIKKYFSCTMTYLKSFIGRNRKSVFQPVCFSIKHNFLLLFGICWPHIIHIAGTKEVLLCSCPCRN